MSWQLWRQATAWVRLLIRWLDVCTNTNTQVIFPFCPFFLFFPPGSFVPLFSLSRTALIPLITASSWVFFPYWLFMLGGREMCMCSYVFLCVWEREWVPYADENHLVLQMTYLILQAINFNQHLLTLFLLTLPLFLEHGFWLMYIFRQKWHIWGNSLGHLSAGIGNASLTRWAVNRTFEFTIFFLSVPVEIGRVF